MVACFFAIAGAAPNARTGWTLRQSQSGSGANPIVATLLTRDGLADSGDAAASSFAFTGGSGFIVGFVAAYTGAIDTYSTPQSTSGSSTTASIPSITPTMSDGAFHAAFGAYAGVVATPSGFTLDSTDSPTFTQYHKLFSDPSASGTISGSVASGSWVGIGIALCPPPNPLLPNVSTAAVQRASGW